MKRAGVLVAVGCRSILGIDDPITSDAGSGSPTIDAGNACLAQASYAPAFSAQTQAAQSHSSGTEVVWEGALDATTYVELILLQGAMDFPTAIGPVTGLDVGAPANTQTRTCDACVFVLAGVGSDGVEKQDYLAISGRLNLTQVTASQITGSFENLIVTPVSIDGNDVSTRVHPECVTTIPSASFSAAITVMP